MTDSSAALAVDLDAESRRALEFDGLLEWVASLARTAAGRRRILAARPTTDTAGLARTLRGVEQARLFLEQHGMLLPGMLPDPATSLEALAVRDLRLEPLALRELAVFLSASTEIRRQIEGLDGGDYDLLQPLARELPGLEVESSAVLEGIDPKGRILDAASPELRRIRQTMGRVGARLHDMLRQILHAPESDAVIQDDFITQRNGRYVIPVRTDAPRPLDGIVHATSGSGATRFVEPMESVRLNNDLVRLAQEEQDEQQRVVAAWTDAFRRRLPDLHGVVEILTHLDDLQARALFGRACGATTPVVAAGGRLRLDAVRHPLLERHLLEQGGRCVPLDLALEPADQVLVLSGPNTGGKTVALKTLGLTALMAQTGLPVPARVAELPLFRQVRADIGDHQSIQTDLSTFSAHLRAMIELLDAPVPPALFLFDEIGTGTEPAEGAALAQAILESLQGPGITAVATTHLGALKAWAFAGESSSCAAMEFDTRSLEPTFRMLMGASGSSAALQIAERLGLRATIVHRARELLGPETQRGETYLLRLNELVADVEGQREALVREREEQRLERDRLEAALATEIEKQRSRAAEELDRALATFRKGARRELAGLTERREQIRLEREARKAETRLAREHAALRQSVSAPQAEVIPDGWRPAERVEPGMRVFVANLAREGRVAGVRGDKVDVQLGSVLMGVDRSELRVPPSSTGDGRPAATRASPGTRGATGDRERRASGGPATRELRLIGQRVEEALGVLDKFLDNAIRDGHECVRIVHGHGSGRLRQAIRAHLSGHVAVQGQRPGGTGEGGDGATVVELR